MTEILKNIFMAAIPLERSPLKELNSYIIKGKDRSLAIDVGFDADSSENAFMSALDEIGIPIEKLDVFLTHHHADHTGLIERLKSKCGKVYLSMADSYHVNNNFELAYWDNALSFQICMGFPADKKLIYTDHPAYSLGTRSYLNFTEVKDGDVLEYGGYTFTAVSLSGHTPGQMGLYDKEHAIFFCGDHILNKITPHITCWDFDNDYLGLFIENLKKVKSYNISHLFSAHRQLIEDPKSRIDGLLTHHDNRISAILTFLEKNGPACAYEVASALNWDFGKGVFKDFPAQQKWFATSEVLAHLEHLRRNNRVILSEIKNEVRYYAKC